MAPSPFMGSINLSMTYGKALCSGLSVHHTTSQQYVQLVVSSDPGRKSGNGPKEQWGV